MKKTILALGVAGIVAFGTSALALDAPTNLRATASGTDVILEWDEYDGFWDTCSNGLNIVVSRNGTGLDTVGQNNGPTSTYTDTGLSVGAYTYAIKATCTIPGGKGTSASHPSSAYSDEATVTIESAPDCAGSPTVTVTPSPRLLWPPNGKLTAVQIEGSVTAQEYCTLPTEISYVVEDEYGVYDSEGTAIVADDGNFVFWVDLGASREGNDLDGRFYDIGIMTDGAEIWTNVQVPHDQRGKK